MTVYIGIDPGKNGGVAWLQDGFEPTLFSLAKTTEPDLWAHLRDFIGLRIGVALIEKPRYNRFPKAAESQGYSRGLMRGLLIAAGIPFEEITAAKWQRAIGLKAIKDESYADHKRRLKARAQELFPGVKITLATADALLLAECCRRMKS